MISGVPLGLALAKTKGPVTKSRNAVARMMPMDSTLPTYAKRHTAGTRLLVVELWIEGELRSLLLLPSSKQTSTAKLSCYMLQLIDKNLQT